MAQSNGGMVVAALALACAAGTALAIDAAAQLAPARAEGEFVHPTRILVRHKPGAPAAAIRDADRKADVIRIVHEYRLVPGLRCVEVPAGTIAQSLAAYEQSPDVLYAHRDQILEALAQTQPYGIGNVRAPQVWPVTRGEGAVVAVLDTGFDYGHPDLPPPLAAESFIAGEAVQDIHSHGTHCSGTVLGLDNDIGVVGVAPAAGLMIGKVLANSGSGPNSGVLAGVDWAVNQGAHVISLSLGGGGYEQAAADMYAAAVAAGATVIAAAGNANTSAPFYPASYPGVISVAAVDASNNRAGFSNYGPLISIAAPGVDVLSTVPTGDATWDGTSRSALPLIGSAAGSASGVSVDCGLGNVPGDFPPQVAGQIAFIRRGAATFAVKAANAAAAGAVGVIIANNVPGNFSGTLNGSSSIPVVAISMEDGNALQTAGAVTVSISTSGGHGYGLKSGTSMACPHVSGVAALLISEFGNTWLTPELLRAAMEQTATDLGDPGRDDLFGHGLVNVEAARAYLASNAPQNCDLSLELSAVLGTQRGAFAVTAGDLNGDGLNDLACANAASDSVSVFINSPGGFGPASNYVVGNSIANSVIADFNGDSLPDLVTAAASGAVSLLTGLGDGTFDAPVLVTPHLEFPYDVKAADLNSDGALDLVVANHNQNQVSVMLGDGLGQFSPPLGYATGNSPNSVAIGDLTGDGVPDVVTSDLFGGTLSVLAGIRGGSLASPEFHAAGSLPRQVALADLDRDGHLDAAVVNAGSSDASVLMNVPVEISQWADQVLGFSSQFTTDVWSAAQALGEPDTFSYCDCFTAWAPLPINGTEEFLAVGFATPVYASGAIIRENQGNGFVRRIDAIDMNDVLHTVWAGVDTSAPGEVVNFAVQWPRTPYLVKGLHITVDTDHDLSTLEEIDAISLIGGPEGARTLAAAVSYRAGPSTHGIALGDLDGDGITDLASGSSTDTQITVRRGLGDGTFASSVQFDNGRSAIALTAADLNGDSKLDLASANYIDQSVSVLLNTNGTPSIVTQPQSQAVQLGASASLSIAAEGAGVLTFQWRHLGVPIAGAIDATYTIDPVTEADLGAYDVAVYGWCHPTVPTISRVAMLTIGSACPADFNQDGGVDGSDIDAFFAAWELGEPAADVNQDGGVDGGDIGTFFAAWENGGC
jgi:serine protease